VFVMLLCADCVWKWAVLPVLQTNMVFWSVGWSKVKVL